jgi:uncharacterized SAM-binding protein YcdF (DUF218 family)
MATLISYGPLAPPGVLITLCLIGAWLMWSRPRLGILVVTLSSGFLYAAAMPLVGSYLLHEIEAKIPAHLDHLSAVKAIVVLGGGVRYGADGEPDTLGPDTLERVNYAARAWRRLRLPVLVSGGAVLGSRATVAGLMKEALEGDFGVPVTWVEDRSRTTWENAVNSAHILNAAGIGTVLVVTHAYHLPRALWSFEQVGLYPVPWPAPHDAWHVDRLRDYFPSAGALGDTGLALHELLGKIYYRLRFAKPAR